MKIFVENPPLGIISPTNNKLGQTLTHGYHIKK